MIRPSAVAWGVMLLSASTGFAQYPEAFRSVPLSRAPIPTEAQPAVRRYRPVEIQGGLFDAAAAVSFEKAKSPRRVQLNLFDNVSHRAVLDKVEYVKASKTTLVWTGRLELMKRGHVTLAVTGKYVSGTVITDDGVIYQIRPAQAAVHWIQEMDFAQLPPEAMPVVVDTPGNPAAAEEAPPNVEAAADDGSLIDVMIVYTPAARAAAGGVTQMENLIALGIADTNQGYANSGIIQRVRLVHSAEVNYTESGSFGTDLNRLRLTTDGFMDNVHALRNSYAADIVSLWVNSGDACGVGYLMTNPSNSFAQNAFNVVHRACVGGYTLAHELGHNMGSAHDLANSNSPGSFPYSFGYQQGTLNPFFRTIMAYQCSAGVNCPRINYWSNPSTSFSGSATGTGSANNALSLNNTRAFVANWRQASTPVQINPTSNVIPQTGGGGIVSVTAAVSTNWTAVSNATNWINITGGSTGSGNGVVSYTVSPNVSPSPRSATLTIGGVPFTITQAGPSADCSVFPIAFNQTLTGALTTSDCISPLRINSYADRYTFSASAGQQVAISLTSSEFDTWLTLLDPSGSILIEDDDGGDGLNSRIPPLSGFFTLPSSGIYTIETTSFSPFATGNYSVQLTTLGGCAYGINPANAVVDASINGGTVAITAGAGCPWTASSNVNWLSVTSAGSGAGPGTTTYFVFANNTGQQRAGTITIAGQTFTVTQTAASGACAVTNIAAGSTINGELTGVDCRSLQRGNNFFADRYSFGGTAGQQISILMSSQILDTFLYLIGPNGTVLATDDDSGGQQNARIPPAGLFSLPSTGTYFIEATTFNENALGSYSIQLSGSSQPPPPAGVSMIGVYRPGGQWFLDLNNNGVYDGPATDRNFPSFGIIAGDRAVVGDWNNTGGAKIGVFRGGQWFFDTNGDGTFNGLVDRSIANFGTAGDLPVVGDWNNTGVIKVGVFRAGQWFLDLNGNGQWDGPGVDRHIVNFGTLGDLPVVGDWNGAGTLKVGVFRNGQWFLDLNGNGQWDGGGIDRFLPGFGGAGDQPVAGDWDGAGRTEIGVYRNGAWFIDSNGDGVLNFGDRQINSFGQAGDQPVAGVWAAGAPGPAGVSKISVFRNGQWFLDVNNNGTYDGTAADRFLSNFGTNGDIGVTGDWNGSGTIKVGVYRFGAWFLDYNGNGQWDGPAVDRAYPNFGTPTDVPVAGDWTGSGIWRIGVYRNGQWFLDLNANGAWDGSPTDRFVANFGIAGDLPVAGDWVGGTRISRIGVFRNGVWFLDTNNNNGFDLGDVTYAFGAAGDRPVAGDWDGVGRSKIGVYRNGQWFLDTNGNGIFEGGDRTVAGFGLAGDTPVVGNWTVPGATDSPRFPTGRVPLTEALPSMKEGKEKRRASLVE